MEEGGGAYKIIMWGYMYKWNTNISEQQNKNVQFWEMN